MPRSCRTSLALLVPFLVVSAVLLAGGCSKEESGASGTAGLEFVDEGAPRPYFHDFGSVAEGTVGQHVFRLVNPYDTDVAIEKLVPSCGCTVPTLRAVHADGTVVEGSGKGADGPRLVVPPGAELQVGVRVDTKDVRFKNTEQLHQLRVTTDGNRNRYFTLEMRMFVAAPWAVNPPAGIQLGAIPVGGESRGSVEIVQSGSFVHRLVELRELPPGVEAELTLTQISGHDVWRLEAGFTPPLERGPHDAKLTIATKDEYGEPADDLVVPLTATAVEDVQADPKRLAMRVVPGVESNPPKRSVSRVLTLLPGHSFRVTEAVLEGDVADRLAVSYEAVSPDSGGASGTWSLVLESAEALPAGVHRGEVVVGLDDPQYPEVRVPYVLHARAGG